LSIQLIEYANRCNIHQASPSAAATANAAQVVVSIQDVFAFTHKSVALAQRPALAEIMAVANSGKLIQLARVPIAHSLSMFQIEFDFITHVKAETGWADVRAGSTRQTALTQLVP
jgi:hypothetical protein